MDKLTIYTKQLDRLYSLYNTKQGNKYYTAGFRRYLYRKAIETVKEMIRELDGAEYRQQQLSDLATS